MVKGEISDGQDILVRVHSECLTSDVFGSARCDCGNQLALAVKQIEASGRGVFVYLSGHEGRGIGLGHKLCDYNIDTTRGEHGWVELGPTKNLGPFVRPRLGSARKIGLKFCPSPT